MADEEAAELRRRLKGPRIGGTGPVPSSSISSMSHRYNPINLIYRFAVMGGSLYSLHSMKVFHQIMRGVKVNHDWFKVCLAASVAIAAIKGYMELYEGHAKKRKVEYQNYKNSTHAVLFLLILASIAFHAALWPAYGGGRTIFIGILIGYGILLQLAILLPIWLQNVVTFVLMTLFIQEYQ